MRNSLLIQVILSLCECDDFRISALSVEMCKEPNSIDIKEES